MRKKKGKVCAEAKRHKAHETGAAADSPAPEVDQRTENPLATMSKHEPPLWKKLVALANEVPDEEMFGRPTDMAEQHDHYIYGTPKRT